MSTEINDITIKHRIPAPGGGTDRIVVQVMTWTGVWKREVVLPEPCYAGDWVSVLGVGGVLGWDELDHKWEPLCQSQTAGTVPPRGRVGFDVERRADEARFSTEDGWEEVK